MKPTIATIDIETSPYLAFVWGLWDQNIGVNQIVEERTILSVGWKPLGGKAEYIDTSDRKNVRDDKILLETLWKLFNDVDIVVAQNGKKFDLKVINARMIMAGMKPYSPVRVVDTKEVAKKYFGFSSNRLEWMGANVAGHPKDDHRKFPGMELWRECLKGNPKAWAEMKKYNLQDVKATEELYLKMLPWISNHPNVGVYTGELHICPNCGSDNVQSRGTEKTQASSYTRYHCQNCGKWSRGKQMLTPFAQRRRRLI